MTTASESHSVEGVPLVSILIKALNEEAKIQRCVETCLKGLDGIPAEVILADSLSSDKTVGLASAYPITIVQLQSEADRGCGVGAQLAYQHSRGKYVYVIDGDMEVPPGFLTAALKHLEANPKVAGVAGQLEELLPSSDLARIRRNRRHPAHAGIGEVEALSGGGLYRRDAIEDAGGYLTHPSLHAHEEFELALRLHHRGWRLERIPTVSMRHSGHADGAFRLLAKRWRTRYAFGSGELIRIAANRAYFLRVLLRFPFHLLAWSIWIGVVASIALATLSIWFWLAIPLLLIIPIVGMTIVKRDWYLGLYAVVGWHVFAAGAIAGMITLRSGDPRRIIPAKIVHRAGTLDSPKDLRAPTEPDRFCASENERLPGSEDFSPNRSDHADTYGARNVRRGLLQFMSGRVYSGVVQITLVALYVRHMVVEDYAAYTTFTALAGLIASLTLVGLERAAMRYYPEAILAGSLSGLRHLVRVLTQVRLALLIIVIGVVLLASDAVLRLLQLSDYRSTLWVAMLFLVGNSTTRYQRYTLQALMLQRELTNGLVFSITARLAIVLLLIWEFDLMTVTWGLGAMAASEWMQALSQYVAYRRYISRASGEGTMHNVEWRPNYAEIRRFAFINGYATILRQLSGKQVILLVGATYLPAASLAAFGFFQALGERIRPYLPIFLTRTIVEPVAMAYYIKGKDFEAFNRVMSVSLKLNLIVISVLAAWLCFSGAPALNALTGGKFNDYTWVMFIILMSLISISNWALLELTANAVGVSTALAKASTLGAGLAVGFLFLSQPWAGVLGLVLTGVSGNLIANYYAVRLLRNAGYRYMVDFVGIAWIVLNATFAGIAGYLAALPFHGAHGFFGSVAGLFCTVGFFLVASFILRPFRTEEVQILVRILPHSIRRRLRVMQ